MTQFSALQTARSVRTRRLAAAEENIEVARAARLAQIFKEICDSIIAYKGEGDPMCLHGDFLSLWSNGFSAYKILGIQKKASVRILNNLFLFFPFLLPELSSAMFSTTTTCRSCFYMAFCSVFQQSGTI